MTRWPRPPLPRARGAPHGGDAGANVQRQDRAAPDAALRDVALSALEALGLCTTRFLVGIDVVPRFHADRIEPVTPEEAAEQKR